MKILHLNSLDSGGASIAVKRINYSLKNKVQSEIFFFKNKKNTFLNFLSKPYSIFDRFISNVNQKNKNITFSSNCVPFSYIPLIVKIKNPDIVHLHWINAGMISIEDLLKIKKPIVWTMHDYWPFSGGYHLPVENIFANDIANLKILRAKKNIYKKIDNISFIAVSKNLMNDAKKSTVLKNKDISFINNPLRKIFFKKKNKKKNRKQINLDDNFTALFCSNNSIFNKNKNFIFFVEIINRWAESNKINLIICGQKNNVRNKFNIRKNIKVIETGFINSDEKLSEIYNAADVTIVPSIQEAFGQVASESNACGTPVIGLKNSGLKDIIDHKVNGYLCEKENVNDFIQGIKWVQNQDKQFLENKCLESALKFTGNKIAEQYINIYNKII